MMRSPQFRPSVMPPALSAAEGLALSLEGSPLPSSAILWSGLLPGPSRFGRAANSHREVPLP
jgi:hypothetical protein